MVVVTLTNPLVVFLKVRLCQFFVSLKHFKDVTVVSGCLFWPEVENVSVTIYDEFSILYLVAFSRLEVF